MKSSFELAMERLNKTAPTVKVSAALKKQLAELDSQCAARIAEREIALVSEINRLADDPEKVRTLREQLVQDRKKLQADLEARKERLRQSAA